MAHFPKSKLSPFHFEHIMCYIFHAELTRVKKAIAFKAVGQLDATAVGAVEGLSLLGAAIPVARQESFEGGEVGCGGVTTCTRGGRGRQAQDQCKQ